MSTLDIFPTKIYKTKFNDIQYLQSTVVPGLDNLFNEAKNNNQRSMHDGVSSFETRNDLHTWAVHKPMVEFINKHVSLYWDTLGYSSKLKPVIRHMWANCYENDGFIDLHNHSPIPIVGVLYLEKESGVANIVLNHPTDILLNYQPFDYGPTAYKRFEQEIDAVSGDLLIFPGYLQHKTLPNDSNKNRIIIGFNITAEEIK